MNVEFVYFLITKIFIPLLLLIIITLIIMMITDRYLFDNLNKKKLEVSKKIDDFLSVLIMNPDTNHLHLKQDIENFKIKVPFEKKWCKELIIQKLIDLKANIYEEKSNTILLTYKYLKLNKYSQSLLKNSSYNKKLAGLYHFEKMGLKIKKGQVKKYLYNHNKYLSSGSLIALIHLSDERFNTLLDYNNKISKADEIKILDVMYQKSNLEPKQIYNWLINNNEAIVSLGIKLLIRYQIQLTQDQIERLLQHPSQAVRKDVIIAIRELRNNYAEDVLLVNLNTEKNTRIKISILKTLREIGTEKTVYFINKKLSSFIDPDIILESLNCLYHIAPNDFEAYAIKDSNENQQTIEKIKLHLKEKLLQ